MRRKKKQQADRLASQKNNLWKEYTSPKKTLAMNMASAVSGIFCREKKKNSTEEGLRV